MKRLAVCREALHLRAMCETCETRENVRQRAFEASGLKPRTANFESRFSR